MLCSVSTRKLNSKWLDRLRSSKGFSTGADADLDLEHFLARQNQPIILTSQQTDPEAQVSSRPSEAPAPNLEGTPLLGDVLAELFAFGPDTSNIPSKKNPRKIPNPRSCKVNSYNNGDLNLRVSQRSDNDSRAEGKELVFSKKAFSCEEDEKVDSNLYGFSRTEVTVIDTSCKGWKFDKFLFRKKNVWKVRDSKSRAFNSENNNKRKMKMKKQRKMSAEEEEVGGCKKKKKVVFGQCSSSKEGKRSGNSLQRNNEDIGKGKLICYT